jgi:hypothetical protein
MPYVPTPCQEFRLRRSIVLTILVAAVLVAVGLAVAQKLLQPGGPPLIEASISPAAISPNADGVADVINIHYSLHRLAVVSIYFVDRAGTRFYFRKDKSRSAGPYDINFSGVVDGYSLPGENLPDTVLARVLQNGQYAWVVEATDSAGQHNQITGMLTVTDADTVLPVISTFTISPPVFTPNQDGIDDHAIINIGLSKDVPPDGLTVFLISADGYQKLPIAEAVSPIQPGQKGLHKFDYDGGINQGSEPPPNGTYTVRATAQDRVGQQVSVEGQLTIALGGLPRADIVLGQVTWSGDQVLIGQLLTFTLVVENYGTAPLRTSGPDSGWVYNSMSQQANTIGQYTQSGAWRIGIHCDTCQTDYPWRWALGKISELTLIPDSNGRPQYYLMPGQKVEVTGGIVLDKIIPSRNPQYFWAGLIHEDVNVVNDRVDPHFITIVAR